jgi:hypothetical protein
LQLQVGSRLMGAVAARIVGAFGRHDQMLLSGRITFRSATSSRHAARDACNKAVFAP